MILVTGGTGFTGSHVCERLLQHGKRVRALVRDPARAADLQRWGAQIVVGDIRDETAVTAAMAGIDTVYHIAATFRQENISRADMFAINADGVRVMLDAAEQAGVGRFVHCSTVGVHGDIDDPPADETAPYKPGDDYQDAKLAGEKIAIAYQKNSSLPVAIFRPAGIHGPRDLRFLKLFRAIENGRWITFGSGEVLYQLVYIDDLVDGILLCGTHPNAADETFILTGREAVTLNQLTATIAAVLDVRPPRLRFPVMPVYLAGWACEMVCKPLGIEPPLYRRRVDFFRKTRSFNIIKAQSEIDYSPQVTLEAGLRRTAAWYRANGYLK